MWAERAEHYLKPLFGLYWKFALTGAEHIPRRGPAIFAPNHSCFLDPWFVSVLSHRPIRWLITRNWYDKSRFWNLFFRAHGTLPVESSAAGTIRVVCDELAKGKLLGVFPEGKISHDGKLQRFFPGVAQMAAASGVPVIPVGIRGAFECLPRQRKFPRPGPIRIHLGAPMTFPEAPWTSPPPRHALREFRDGLRERIGDLAGQPVEEPIAAAESTSDEAGERAAQPF